MLPISSTDASNQLFYTSELHFTARFPAKTIELKSSLDKIIDFSVENVSLIVDVAPSIVEKYRSEEKEKRRGRYSFASARSSNVNHNQQKQVTTLLECFEKFIKNESN